MTTTDFACIGRLARESVLEGWSLEDGQSPDEIEPGPVGERLVRELEHAGYRIVRLVEP